MLSKISFNFNELGTPGIEPGHGLHLADFQSVFLPIEISPRKVLIYGGCGSRTHYHGGYEPHILNRSTHPQTDPPRVELGSPP